MSLFVPPDGMNEDDRCKVVQIDGPSTRRLESRASILHDLSFILATCRILVDHLESEEPQDESTSLPEALWTAILIAYERCFSSGKRISLSYSDLDAIDPSGGAKALHKHYEAMRNKHLAHSINPFGTIQVGAILASTASGRREVDGIGVASVRHTSGEAQEVRQLASLVTALHHRVAQECDELCQNQVLEEARSVDIEELYKRDDMSFTVPGPDAAGRPRP